jgi:hypothetical protein
MTSDPRKSLINFDILAIVSVCGLLFIAAVRGWRFAPLHARATVLTRPTRSAVRLASAWSRFALRALVAQDERSVCDHRACRTDPAGRANIQITIAFVFLGLLMWVEPASAQRSLTVARHDQVSISDAQVDGILIEASKALRQCNVVLKRNGRVATFTSPNPEGIVGKGYRHGDPNSEREAARERDAVHRESFDIKIVNAINFCRVGGPQGGCAWDPRPGEDGPQRKSMIVAMQIAALGIAFTLSNKQAGGIWAHEFGHRMGLPHRPQKTALMYECNVGKQISDQECTCFRQGCSNLDPGPAGGGDRCDTP